MAAQIKIGNYSVLETLGVGSFGKVKLAVHTLTGHRVALKSINRRKIANMDMVGRVKREIQYLKLLRHPHIIKLYEVIQTPTDIIMVMEYAPYELFNYIVEKGRLPEDEARRFFQQIICALEYCHRHRIVHRDLKPENILLDEYYNVKLADFGLSNNINDGDFLKTSCGSPNYAAPEVISGRLYAGQEVDVWSAGVMLYVMLCGRLPFDDDYIPTLFKKINGGIFTLPTILSSATKSLISSMLMVDPLKRISINEIRATEWFNVGLPDYLKPLPENLEEQLEDMDMTIVEELEKKTPFAKEMIFRGLRERENNQIKVAYQLISDHKQMLADAQAFQSKTVQSLVATYPKRDRPSVSSSIKVLSSNLPNKVGESDGKDGKKKTRTKWHFGIRSRSAPADIMLEIYRALKNVGMRWKTLDPYRVRAKYTSSTDNTIKLELQLYQVEPENYLLDFKNCTPPKVALNPHDRWHFAFTTRRGSNASAVSSYSASSSASGLSTPLESGDDGNDTAEDDDDAKSSVTTRSDAPSVHYRHYYHHKHHHKHDNEVAVSTFVFFEACAALIKELAT